jgi:uncharacterized membrane protein YsdA (DUF1294 family)
MDLLIAYLLLINAAGLLIMLIDKRKAIKNRWRIPEKTMFTVAVLGGSFGVYAGMQLFRHKTKHAKFYIGVPVILAIQIILSVFLITWTQK